MGVRVTFEGESMAEVTRMIQQAGLVGGVPAPVAEASEVEPEKPAATEGKKPVGRPRKAPVADEAETPKPEAPKAEEPPKEVEKPKPAKKLALDDVRTALQDFAKRQDGDPQAGILKVRELLMSFKSVKGEPCQKISEVQDEDYPAVVAKCAA